ncbi:MAG TPA: hypothetical protein VJY42_02300 [Candidatus Methanomethylophilaceae archaeon]|nr:hypothetical protein [Candidatus Methanomethylophilaceae archaeon]
MTGNNQQIRNRYRMYQNMLDAMVNVIDSIRLTADEAIIEESMLVIRKDIRFASRTLDEMHEILNREYILAMKEKS